MTANQCDSRPNAVKRSTQKTALGMISRVNDALTIQHAVNVTAAASTILSLSRNTTPMIEKLELREHFHLLLAQKNIAIANLELSTNTQ